jgi:hypothetical protein
MVFSCIVSFSEAEGGAGEAAEPEAAPGRGLVPEPQGQVNKHLFFGQSQVNKQLINPINNY